MLFHGTQVSDSERKCEAFQLFLKDSGQIRKFQSTKFSILIVTIWNNCSIMFGAHKICCHTGRQKYYSALTCQNIISTSFHQFKCVNLLTAALQTDTAGPKLWGKYKTKCQYINNCYFCFITTVMQFTKVSNIRGFNILENDFSDKGVINCSQQTSL